MEAIGGGRTWRSSAGPLGLKTSGISILSTPDMPLVLVIEETSPEFLQTADSKPPMAVYTPATPKPGKTRLR